MQDFSCALQVQWKKRVCSHSTTPQSLTGWQTSSVQYDTSMEEYRLFSLGYLLVTSVSQTSQDFQIVDFLTVDLPCAACLCVIILLLFFFFLICFCVLYRWDVDWICFMSVCVFCRREVKGQSGWPCHCGQCQRGCSSSWWWWGLVGCLVGRLCACVWPCSLGDLHLGVCVRVNFDSLDDAAEVLN